MLGDGSQEWRFVLVGQAAIKCDLRDNVFCGGLEEWVWAILGLVARQSLQGGPVRVWPGVVACDGGVKRGVERGVGPAGGGWEYGDGGCVYLRRFWLGGCWYPLDTRALPNSACWSDSDRRLVRLSLMRRLRSARDSVSSSLAKTLKV